MVSPTPVRAPRAWLPWLVAAIALVPLVAFRRDFADLFWFGDDWDHLDQIARFGFWPWAGQVFAENFVPLFKILWGGLAIVGGGSHFLMVVALWMTHAVAVWLFIRLLQDAGMSDWSAGFCGLMFGLATMNIETLGWTTQWSAVLATTCFLAAVWWFWRTDPLTARWSVRVHGVLFALAAASALSFSRGALTGLGLAALCLWPWHTRAGWGRRAAVAALCVAPAVFSTAMILAFATGNQQHISGHVRQMLIFASWYFALSPLYRWLGLESWGWETAYLVGLLKVALIVHGLGASRGRLRALLGLLVLVELGNAALLGLGRYHTGLPVTVSMRYQYSALIGTVPFVALALEALWERLPKGIVRAAGAALCAAICVWPVVRHWPEEASSWADWRGRNTRHTLFVDPAPPAEGAITGIPYLKTARAKELVARYHLH